MDIFVAKFAKNIFARWWLKSAQGCIKALTVAEACSRNMIDTTRIHHLLTQHIGGEITNVERCDGKYRVWMIPSEWEGFSVYTCDITNEVIVPFKKLIWKLG